ncbi:PD-(D/E)XK nuclease domain-containing protein [Sphingobacterium siyangense]|uniref:PD-(D/E)XK nuclease domain-containing protein n=1 Tax=Sphingobacterium siyangense TaxID=459529 RepID=UPI00196359D4|nr:hypothetical protein [Sphingobacterium siyangense]QRY55932.1 hypothetical protein JVX97_18105 [Sphingobacterium siyangense]
MVNFQNILNPLKARLKVLEEKEASDLFEINEELKDVVKFSEYMEDQWVGGWGQTNFNYYKHPTDETKALEVKVEYFYELLQERHDMDIHEIELEVKELLDELKAFQQDLITELSVIRGNEKLSSELELLDKLENFQWGYEINEYVSIRTPKTIPVTHMSVLNKGIQPPPHIIVTGLIVSLATKSNSGNEFIKLAKRILRQIELKLNIQESAEGIEINELILRNIFDNFHSFCKQLKNRHSARDTIEVNDEYDVQDLLHSILKLHFKDVREEEYTPSFAGSSTRMDFLLKNEKIVIEVKKTRDNLKDKEIGQQLILDVAHYKNHPECKILYCFVYDPDNKVKNSNGVEGDINAMSTDDMQVALFIRP